MYCNIILFHHSFPTTRMLRCVRDGFWEINHHHFYPALWAINLCFKLIVHLQRLGKGPSTNQNILSDSRKSFRVSIFSQQSNLPLHRMLTVCTHIKCCYYFSPGRFARRVRIIADPIDWDIYWHFNGDNLHNNRRRCRTEAAHQPARQGTSHGQWKWQGWRRPRQTAR